MIILIQGHITISHTLFITPLLQRQSHRYEGHEYLLNAMRETVSKLQYVLSTNLFLYLTSFRATLCQIKQKQLQNADICYVTFSCIKCQQLYAEVKSVLTVKLRLKLVKM